MKDEELTSGEATALGIVQTVHSMLDLLFRDRNLNAPAVQKALQDVRSRLHVLDLEVIMESILAKHGDNAILNVRADDGSWTVRDVITQKCLADGDLLVEIDTYMP